ncbi:hypothetical protein TUN199_08732 [Pyrenophora tritici-repentis]|nr:hypothetical protein Alg130_08732 [Pyrenophora tritici-repentis]KAI0607047.1 hypothetical protein TUN205_08706 [Pyrenophora tritici-repentis]KAI0619277.1 hypothetical protein TUN199_08732 [Pyrenophora tritici-repentis]
MSSDPPAAVRAHLALLLSAIQEPTTEKILLQQQPSPSPIRGIALEQFLLRHPPTGIPATIIYAILFKVMNALTTLHKHHVVHGNVCAEKIILEMPAVASLFDQRATHMTVHLLLSRFSTVTPAPVTNTQSEDDVKGVLHTITNLAIENEYVVEKKNNRIDHHMPPVSAKPSALLAELVWDLENMKIHPTGLESLRQKWWKPMALVLMVPNVQATQEEVEEMRSKAPDAFTELLPEWCIVLCVVCEGPRHHERFGSAI